MAAKGMSSNSRWCQPHYFLRGVRCVLIVRENHSVASMDRFNVRSIRHPYARGTSTGSSNGSGPVSLKRPRSSPTEPFGYRQRQTRHLSSFDDQYKYVAPEDRSQQGKAKGTTSSRSIADQSGKDGGPTDSFISHITSGGTPCDPAPAPFQLADFGEESLYTLVLLRHGESEWNKLNQYTGWVDVNLTAEGKKEARDAGRLLYENGIEIDHAFTSVLKRASFSCNMALNTARQHWVPVTKTWRLNERHYGALQGYNKDTAFRELGLDQELVMQMRRSYDVRPPIMQDDHPYWHGNDRRYRKLSPEQLEASRAESLKDTADRIMPFYNSVIAPSLRSGNRCLVVSHANTIRTLIKQIDNISDEDIKGMSIPTGIPLLYRLDKDLRPVDPIRELEFRYLVEPKGYTWGTDLKHGFHGVYLGDLKRLQDIQMKRDTTNRNWQRVILYNIAKSLHEETPTNGDEVDTSALGGDSVLPKDLDRRFVYETRQLWWKLHEKMQQPEYGNMLLLVRMKDELEERCFVNKQRHITFGTYEKIVNKLHVDAEDHVVEPFVEIAERQDREERQRLYYESVAQDMEEEYASK